MDLIVVCLLANKFYNTLNAGLPFRACKYGEIVLVSRQNIQASKQFDMDKPNNFSASYS